MIKNLIIMMVCLISYSVFAQVPVSKDIILSRVMRNELPLRSERLLWFLTDSMNKFAHKQKLVNPKFDVKYLKKRYIEDNSYRYEFIFNYVTSQCVYIVVPRDTYRKSAQCRERFFQCVYDENSTVTAEKTQICIKKIDVCKFDKSNFKEEIIENKYCEKIYGDSKDAK